MNIQLIQKKIKYYCDWWNDLPLEEKKGWLGAWIRDRINHFDDCIKDHLKQVERFYL